MKTVCGLLVLMCALSYQCVKAGGGLGKCKEEFIEVCKEANGIIEAGNLQCVEEMNLPQFNCTTDKNAEERKDMVKEMKKGFKNLSDAQKKNVKGCFKELFKGALEAAGDKVSEECKDKLKKIQNKMESSEEDSEEESEEE